jgi:hypothetical protein
MRALQQGRIRPLPFAQKGDGLTVRRNPFVRSLKSLLASSHHFLPGAVYWPLYNAAFRTYKGLLRLSYFRLVLYHAVIGNQEGLTRAKLVHSVMPYSLVASSGLEATFAAASDLVSRKIPGDFIECGVAQGGCSALMAAVAKTDPQGRRMWLFDSFQGLPDPTEEDYDETKESTGQHIRPLPRGSCVGGRDQVETLVFSKLGLSRDSVFLVEGWFQDTLPVHRDRIGQIALLRIDGDWYESTLCCLQNLYDLVSPGGWVIIDDYGVCFGCKKAVHEFLDGRGMQPQFMTDGRGGILFLKAA